MGRALAVQLASDYDEVLLGSREKQKAEKVVSELIDKGRGRDKEDLKEKLKPATNEEVARSSDIVFATLPAKHAVSEIRELVGQFRGDQILISTAAPTPKLGKDFLPSIGGEPPGSIARRIKEELLPRSVKVAAAFQTVPADTLLEEGRIDADVAVSCDDEETYGKVAKIVEKIDGLRPLYLGTLEVSGVLEGLTSVLLNVGEHNHIKSPTIKFNGTTEGKEEE